MADNRIDLVAGLNVNDSADAIRDDLKLVKEKLGDEALKITCTIDDKSISALETKLNDIKINIGGVSINSGAIDNSVSKVVSNIQHNLSSSAKVDLSMNTNEIEQFIDKLTTLNIYGLNIAELQKRFENLNVAIESITPTFVTLEEGGEKALSSLAVKGKDSFGNLVNYIETYNTKSGEFIRGTTKVTENLNKIEQSQVRIKNETTNTQKAYNEFLKLQGKYDVYFKQYQSDEQLTSQLAKISELLNEFDNTDPLDKQRESLIKIDNALKLVEVDIKRIRETSAKTNIATSDFYPSIAKTGSTSEILESAKESLNETFANSTDRIEDKASRVKRAVEDTSGELQRFYVQVERGDKSVETLTYALNEQGTAYEYLGKTIREADNSTDFRRKDIGTQWDIQTEKLKQFITNAEKAGAASTILKDDIVNLKNKLTQGGDTSAMNAFLDDFDIAKAKLQAFNAEARKQNAIANLQNRIKRLTADVNNYAAANQRAVNSTKEMTSGKSFADEFARISSAMARGADLTDREVKDLSADFAVLKKEASAAGLQGSSAFGKFLGSFKTMSTYVTANMVFNFVKRQLQQMAQEVINVDTAMVELRKVTEATDAEFEQFAESAAKTGRQLGASISEVINATSEFARAGFNLPDAEELGKIATLYKNVGDGIGIDDASETIVSVVKAFNIEAQNSIEVIDKINEVSNRAAIDSGGLGFALKRVASAMESANNTLDETIALTATANEIVQNPEMVSQGWRTVALRIRGKNKVPPYKEIYMLHLK